MQQIEQCRSSLELRCDWDVLRERLADDGYLYLPGLLSSERVHAVCYETLHTFAKKARLEDGSAPHDACPGSVRIDHDDGWCDDYVAILAIEIFYRLAQEPAVLDVIRGLLGESVFVHPHKTARITYLGTGYPTPPHLDSALTQDSGGTLTISIPLGDCPAKLGSLRVLAGPHKEGLQPMTVSEGAGGVRVEGVDANAPRWRTVDNYAAGDVLVAHCLTMHAAPSNRGGWLRLSGDFRIQSSLDPIALGALLPTAFGGGNSRGWWQLTDCWSTTWWCEIGQPVRIVNYKNDPLSTPISRIAV